jgi:hypothetical protein
VPSKQLSASPATVRSLSISFWKKRSGVVILSLAGVCPGYYFNILIVVVKIPLSDMGVSAKEKEASTCYHLSD